MKLFHKLLFAVLVITAAITINLTATLKKPSYSQLLITSPRKPVSDYGFVKILDELVIINHTVKKGENIRKIARKYGTDISTIRGINNLEIKHLSSGKRISVINKKGHLHKLKPGETIERLARKYKTSPGNIYIANNIEEDDEILPGTEIFIPGVKIKFSNFIWPVINCRLTSRFGIRTHPIFRIKRFHEGTDLAKYRGAKVRASAGGRVIFAGRLGGYGKTVIIKHRKGFSTIYGHLAYIAVKNKQYVKAGRYIGKIGSTGVASGPHLHFEIRRYGRARNPLKYLVIR